MEDKRNDYTGELRRMIEKIYESTAEQLNTVVDMTYEGMKKECMTWGELQKKNSKRNSLQMGSNCTCEIRDQKPSCLFNEEKTKGGYGGNENRFGLEA